MRRAALLVVLLFAGCSFGGDGGGRVEQGELRSLVLQPEDLPRVFVRFDEGRQAIADNPGGSRADTQRFSRQGGWKARYRRSGTPRTAGPLVVESRADVFDSSTGADEDLDAARSDLEEAELDWQRIDEPGLGDESFAATLVQRGGTGGVRFYEVFWREANVTASLSVNGFEGQLALAEALELARKQERRIAAAAS